MSCSSLWIMNKDYYGEELIDFDNSWWFSPIIWETLLEKYMHNEIYTSYGYKKTFMTDSSIMDDLNKIMNNCDSITDRICWELTMQQVFYTKDKYFIVESIKKFLQENVDYSVREEDSVSVLELEHIISRFDEICNAISDLDGDKYPYFIFKNTSCDNNVERLFEVYDEELDEYINTPLSDYSEIALEFVEITNGKINFISNIDYFKK